MHTSAATGCIWSAPPWANGLPPDLKAWVKQKAAETGVSASVYVRDLIERHRAETERSGR
jgi:hypothetical protein